MQNRVAVKPDYVDSRWGAPGELLDHSGLKPGQLFFAVRNRTGAAENRSQSFAKRLLVRDRQRGAGDHPLSTIGLDHRGVDPIERSTAHQPERPRYPRG